MLVLGDAHADDKSNQRALLAAYDDVDTDSALQVGDLLYYNLPLPTWFIAGNNEDFDVIESLRAGNNPEKTRNVRLLASTAVELQDIRVAGLSGNHAPTQYNKTRSELNGDRRRHFVKEDVERATDLTDVDVFLTHEAPHGLLRTEGYDVGCKHIDTILRSLEPDLCLVGHHHQHAEGKFNETTVVSLAPVWKGYYILDPETLSLERHPLPQESR
jgi:Icc-related predicted phosphoesterase